MTDLLEKTDNLAYLEEMEISLGAASDFLR